MFSEDNDLLPDGLRNADCAGMMALLSPRPPAGWNENTTTTRTPDVELNERYDPAKEALADHEPDLARSPALGLETPRRQEKTLRTQAVKRSARDVRPARVPTSKTRNSPERRAHPRKQNLVRMNTGQRYSGCRLSSSEKVLDRGDECHGPAQFDPRG